MKSFHIIYRRYYCADEDDANAHNWAIAWCSQTAFLLLLSIKSPGAKEHLKLEYEIPSLKNLPLLSLKSSSCLWGIFGQPLSFYQHRKWHRQEFSPNTTVIIMSREPGNFGKSLKIIQIYFCDISTSNRACCQHCKLHVFSCHSTELHVMMPHHHPARLQCWTRLLFISMIKEKFHRIGWIHTAGRILTIDEDEHSPIHL